MYKPNMPDLQMLGNSFFANLAWYRRTKDLVPLFITDSGPAALAIDN